MVSIDLPKEILQAYKYNKVVNVMVFGPMGAGKTSFSLWTAYYVYNGNWREALDHLFFDIRESLPLIRNAIKANERIPLLIFDDAGLWLSSFDWYHDTSRRNFVKFFHTIRSIAGGIIFTAPTKVLPKIIDKTINYKVKITEVYRKFAYEFMENHLSPEDRREIMDLIRIFNLKPEFALAKIYKHDETVHGKRMYKLISVNIFPRFYPDEVYYVYTKRRDKAVSTTFEQLEKALTEKAETNA